MRRRLYRGVCAFDGLVLSPEAPDSLVFALWTPGTTLRRLEDERILITWAEPRLFRAETAPGLPLRGVTGGFTDHETADAINAGELMSLEGGRARRVPIGGPIDPGTLLDLDDWNIVVPPEQSSRSMGTAQMGVDREEPRAAPPAIAETAATVDARAALGLPAPDDATRRAWRGMAGSSQRSTAPRRRVRTGAESATGITSPGWFDRLRANLARRLGGDPRQPRYLRDLQQRFARGDLEEALRRAIPFGGEDGPETWGVPSRRNQLTPSPTRHGGRSTIPIDADVQQQLRVAYESAFEKLDRAGRTREAAFVLVDLLDQPDRGCSYLESHGELGLAADLAAGRATDPSLAVRLLWKAGDPDRALTIARRHGAFAAAIARCERNGDADSAASLRREWSSRLLASGDLVGAYDALIGCEDAASGAIRDRVLELGLRAEGELHSRMTARSVRARHPDAHEHVEAIVAQARGPEAPVAMSRGAIALADDLAGPPTVPFDADAVRPLLRLLVEIDGGASKRVKTIATRSRDDVFRNDLPPKTPVRSDSGPLPVSVHVDSFDRGVIPVRDARALADGSTVGVLEGIGIRVFRPDGRRRLDIDVHCDFVILSDHGASVIACRRVDSGSVSAWLVHLVDGKIQSLGEVRASMYASSFDGSTWFVAHQSTLWMLDILADGPTALWAQADLGGSVVGLARSSERLAVAAYRGDSTDGRVNADAFLFTLPALTGYGMNHVIMRPGSELIDDGSVVFGATAYDKKSVALTDTTQEGTIVTVRSRGSDRGTPRATLSLPSQDVTVHLDNGILVTSDREGRIERLDLAQGRRLQPIRTSV